MTITDSEIQRVAPDVAPEAQKMEGFTNPFISLQSLESLCQGDETLEECLRDTVMLSLRYAETVCRFKEIVLRGQQSNEDGERKEIEQVRSTVHDSTIASINILSRRLKLAGKDNTWISKLKAGKRASYGKFAILLAFETVLRKNEHGK